jgi:hypothetical protein
LADVAVEHADSSLLQPLQIAPTAAAAEVVDAGDLYVAPVFLQRQGEF